MGFLIFVLGIILGIMFQACGNRAGLYNAGKRDNIYTEFFGGKYKISKIDKNNKEKHKCDCKDCSCK